MNTSVFPLEIKAPCYRSLMVSFISTFLFAFFLIFSIVCDQLHERGASGYIAIAILTLLFVGAACWWSMEVKVFRNLVGPLFPPNPGYSDNRDFPHHDWSNMMFYRNLGILMIFTGLLVSFNLRYFPFMLLKLMFSSYFFCVANEYANELRGRATSCTTD